MYKYSNYFWHYFSYIFCSIIIILPILFFDVNDYEEYNQGIYSVKYLFSSFNNFFSNYNFDLGLGTFMPIGQGLFFYPTSILSFNLKLFTISTILINIFIQYYFFLRISKIFSISENNIYNFSINILLIISLSNLAFSYLDDWISGHTLYSIFFALIFYLIKYGKKNTQSSLNKFTLFFLIAFINGHLGHLIIFLLLLSLIFFLNIKNFKLNLKNFILPFLVSLIICIPRLVELFNIYLTYPQLDPPSLSPKYQNFFDILKYPINFILRVFDYFFYLDLANKDIFFHSKILGYGPQLIFGFLIALFLIFKKKSRMIFNLDKVYFLIFILILIIDFLPIGNYGLFLRDFLNIIFLIIFLFFLNQKISNKINYLCLFTLLISNLFMFTESFRHLKSNDVISIFKDLNNKYSYDLRDYLISIKENDNIFSRVYISENVFKDINNKRNVFYKINSIYSPKDFTKYNLSVLNVSLKNSLNNNIRIPKLKMHNQLFPINKEIESKFLMNFYQIKYVFLYKDEAEKIDLSNFIKEKTFLIDEKKLIILRNLDFGKQQYEIKNYKDLSICNDKIISHCLLNDEKKFKKNDKIKILKISNSRIEINNLSDRRVNLVLPFIKNHSWNKDNESLIYDELKVISINPNNQLIVDNKSIIFIINKLIFIFTLIIFIYHIYLSKQKLKGHKF